MESQDFLIVAIDMPTLLGPSCCWFSSVIYQLTLGHALLAAGWDNPRRRTWCVFHFEIFWKNFSATFPPPSTWQITFMLWTDPWNSSSLVLRQGHWVGALSAPSVSLQMTLSWQKLSVCLGVGRPWEGYGQAELLGCGHWDEVQQDQMLGSAVWPKQPQAILQG